MEENIEKKGTGSNQYQQLKSTSSTLAEIGISKDESSKAQRIAKLDLKQFEEYIQETKATNQEVTLSGAVRVERKKGEWLEENIQQGSNQFSPSIASRSTLI